MRGFSGVGLVRPKDDVNIGAAARAAQAYGAKLLCVEKPRASIKLPTDTGKYFKHNPVLRVDSLKAAIPYGAVPVAVDLVEDAEPLHTFKHPESAFYVFGPEDGTLGAQHLSWCPFRVYIPTAICMNLAATVNVVLYDRAAKLNRWPAT